MAKKFLIVLLVLLVIGLAGCTTPNDDANSDTNTGDNLTPPQKEENKYKVSFIIDGSPIYTVSMASSSTIELPSAPQKPGKAFVGWYLESQTPKNKIDGNYFVTKPIYEDTNVYGHYVDAAYTVSFYEDGNLVHTLVTNGAESIVLPEATARDGYTFDGWFLDPGVYFKEVFPDTFANSPIYGDISLHAHYSVSAELKLFETVITGIDTCAIIGFGDGVSMTDLVIPSELVINVGGVDKVYSVASIFPGAFINNTDLETLVVPSSVTKIYDNAFKGCSNLSSIYVPNSVVDVDPTSFLNTNSIVRATAPLNVLTCLNRSNLKYVEINGGDTIAEGMFKNADNLLSVVFNADLKNVEAEAFYDCDNLNTVSFNDGLVSLGENAFYNCDKISEISLPATLTAIAETTFRACSSVNRISVDAANTVYECNNSNCIVVKDGKKLIFGCKNTTIYEGIEVIGEYAFIECTGLTSLYIPWTVESIADGAFADCINLGLINVQKNNENYLSANNCLIHLVETPDSVINVLVLGCKNSIITELMNISEITAYAFSGCVNLSEIYIPSTVSTIVAGSFDGCVGLGKVTINNPDLTFEGDVFADCRTMHTVVLPLGMNSDSIKDSGVFATCRSLKNLEASVDIVPYFLGIARTSLQNLAITEGESISDGLFSGCTNLTTVHLPASVTVIGDAAFEGCKKLASVKLAENTGLSAVGYNAFRDCVMLHTFSTDNISSVTGVVIPASLVNLGNGAFYNTSVTSLSFADGAALTTLGYNVFAECDSLYTISIPAHVTYVDYAAFEGTNNITTATIPADVIRCLGNCDYLSDLNVISGTKIDNHALRGLTSLRTLTICATVTEIDNRAFEGCTGLVSISVDSANTVYYVEGNCLIEDKDGVKTVVLGIEGAVIPGDVHRIASYAFSKSDITSIVIPDSVEIIKAFAFSECTSLTSLVIDGDVTVEENAFVGCSNIENATVPTYVLAHLTTANLENLTLTTGGAVPANALKDCVTLVTLTLSDDITTIGDYAFFGCVNLVAVTLPDSVTAVGEYAFSKCKKLETVTVGAGVETLGAHAFHDCAKLTNVHVADLDHWCSIEFADVDANPIANGAMLYENGVLVDALNLDTAETINNYAFHGYKGIKDLVIPECVKDILAYAFAESEISSLTLVGVAVEDHAFYNCLSLTDLEVLDGAKIHEDAFLGNVITTAKLPTYALRLVALDKLETLVITSGEELAANCLKNFLNIKTLVVCDEIATIADGAFDGCTTIENVTGPFIVLSHIANKDAVKTIVITSGEVDDKVLEEFVNRVTVALPA